MMKLSAESN